MAGNAAGVPGESARYDVALPATGILVTASSYCMNDLQHMYLKIVVHRKSVMIK